MALGIVKYFYDRPSQPIGVILFVVSLSRSVVVHSLLLDIIEHCFKRLTINNFPTQYARIYQVFSDLYLNFLSMTFEKHTKKI